MSYSLVATLLHTSYSQFSLVLTQLPVVPAVPTVSGGLQTSKHEKENDEYHGPVWSDWLTNIVSDGNEQHVKIRYSPSDSRPIITGRLYKATDSDYK